MSARGFTFLEIIVTLALIALVVFTSFNAFNRSFSQIDYIENRQLAINLTESQLEILKDTSFASIVSSAPARFTVSGYSNFEQQIEVSNPYADLKQVAVTTYWPAQNSEESFRLTTYVSN